METAPCGVAALDRQKYDFIVQQPACGRFWQGTLSLRRALLPDIATGGAALNFPITNRKETFLMCVFCKIAAGEIPANKLYEDEKVLAFYDLDPQAPIHFLVIPKEHIASAGEITPENSALVAHIFEVIAKICVEHGWQSYRIVNNCGEQAGQTVPHLHFHVLSGRDMTWPPG